MPKTITQFAISKATDIPPKPELNDFGAEIWYDTKPEALKALDDLDDKKEYVIVEKKTNQ